MGKNSQSTAKPKKAAIASTTPITKTQVISEKPKTTPKSKITAAGSSKSDGDVVQKYKLLLSQMNAVRDILISNMQPEQTVQELKSLLNLESQDQDEEEAEQYGHDEFDDEKQDIPITNPHASEIENKKNVNHHTGNEEEDEDFVEEDVYGDDEFDPNN